MTSSPAHALPFAWANFAQLHGTSLGEMKVTDSDPANSGDNVHLACDPADYGYTSGWPYPRSLLETIYQATSPGAGAPDYDQGPWDLNSANDTYATMQASGLNLFFADVNGTNQIMVRPSWEARDECNWLSWAALNDTIDHAQNNGLSTHDSYTGIFLGPGSQTEDDWACTDLEFIERARLEAADHPDIVKALLFDELWRLLEAPDHTWGTDGGTPLGATLPDGKHWDSSNVDALQEALAGNYLGPDANIYGQVDTLCRPKASSLSGSTVELWARMIPEGLPRYVVDSAVLGVPKDLAMTGSADFDFLAGQALAVAYELPVSVSEWQFMMPLRIELEFLSLNAATVDPALNPGLDLETIVNGTTVDTIALSSRTHKDIDSERLCLWSNVSPVPAGCSNSLLVSPYVPYTNTLTFNLSATADTDPNTDRIAYVWGVRLHMIDHATDQIISTSDYILPSDGAYSFHSNAVGDFPGAAGIASDNSAWRVRQHIDGVTIANADPKNPRINDEAFELLTEHACATLHELPGPLATPKRCIVDERGWAAESAYYPFDLQAMQARMEAGDAYGDGVVSTYYPLSLENVGTNGGRFVERGSKKPSYPTMVVEPRYTRTFIGEEHFWEATVPSGCDPNFAVDYELVIQASSPKFEWFVEHDDGLSPRKEVGLSTSGISTATVDFVTNPDINRTVAAGEIIRVGWRAKGGSATPEKTNAAYFVENPSTGCTLNWTFDSAMVDPDVDDVASCLRSYLSGGTPTCP